MIQSKYTFVVLGGLFQSDERIRLIHRNAYKMINEFFPGSEVIFPKALHTPTKGKVVNKVKEIMKLIDNKQNLIFIGSSSGAVILQIVASMPDVRDKTKGLIMMGYSHITKFFLQKEFNIYLKKIPKIERVLSVGGYWDIIAPFFIAHPTSGITMSTAFIETGCNFKKFSINSGHLGYWDMDNLKKVLIFFVGMPINL